MHFNCTSMFTTRVVKYEPSFFVSEALQLVLEHVRSLLSNLSYSQI